MLYFDTSFLAPLLLEEATSSQVAAVFKAAAADQLTISHWTRVEFSSLLAREVRMGALDHKSATQLKTRFELLEEGSFTTLAPTVADFSLAAQYIDVFETGLRAGDALHLAIARNHHASMVYSLDKTMLKAGKILGVPVAGLPARA